MKVVVIAVSVLCACSKPDDVAALRDEARSISIYYEGQLDRIANRAQHMFEHTPIALQPTAAQLLAGAGARIHDTYALVDHFAGRTSKLEHMANDMTDPDQLKGLVDNQRAQLSATMAALGRELDLAERQLGQMTPEGAPH